jgi:hypothetical protein
MTLFGTSSHATSLASAIISIASICPNLSYLAINFYSHLLPSIISSTTSNDKDNFQDLLFLSAALSKISEARKGIKTFALWCDGSVKWDMNLDRPVDNIKKSVARDIRRGFERVR